MEKKIRVLFYNLDQAGVNYFRTQTPAMELERNHSDDFHVEINQNIDFKSPETLEYLKSFDIINYHRQLHPDVTTMVKLKQELNKNGTLLIMDIDDYWHLPKTHPYYSLSREKKMYETIVANLKIANYVTTTTEIFADKIREITGKDNVVPFYNAIDPTWMKQFKNNWEADPDNLVRITYMAGSSHMGDIDQLTGVVNMLNNDPQTKNKFKIIIGGWDMEGNTTEIKFNKEFGLELQKIGLWTKEVVDIINKTKGDVDMIPKLPDDLKEKYRGNVFATENRPIASKESIYYVYENILTDNHHLIQNEDYKKWLMNFDRNSKYENEGFYGRRWTQKANMYATTLDETDIVIAPLAVNDFNKYKSNLKQIECWSRKIPIVCSDIEPYRLDGKHMINSMLVPNKKNAHKYWFKYLKKLIVDENFRKEMGENLHNDFKDKYNLANVTEKRADFYKSILK